MVKNMNFFRFLTVLLIIGLFAVGCNLPIESQSSSLEEEQVVIQPSETSLPTAVPMATYTPTTVPVPDNTVSPTPEEELPGALSLANIHQISMTAFEQKENIRGIGWIISFNASIALLSGYELSVFNASDASLIRQIGIPAEYAIFDISPDGSLLACTDDYQRVLLLSTVDLSQVAVIEPDTFVSSANFNAEGTKIVIASNDILVAIEADTRTGDVIKVHSGFSTAAPVYSVVYSQYSDDLVWYSRGRVQIQNPISDLLSTDFRHEDWVNSFAISPDGEYLATGTAKSIEGVSSPGIQLWRIATGEDLGFIKTDYIPSSLFYSKDGTLLIGAVGTTLNFWDTSTGELIIEYSGHIDSIYTASLSPSGDAILTASTDGQTILWHLP